MVFCEGCDDLVASFPREPSGDGVYRFGRVSRKDYSAICPHEIGHLHMGVFVSLVRHLREPVNAAADVRPVALVVLKDRGQNWLGGQARRGAVHVDNIT